MPEVNVIPPTGPVLVQITLTEAEAIVLTAVLSPMTGRGPANNVIYEVYSQLYDLGYCRDREDCEFVVNGSLDISGPLPRSK
jgi:hypothetical protein